ncbi:MAG: glycosyltransferase family 2 protein [Nanoarchaeota archaeon]|nr:glycosyltransferase family 2 protein [Nanoarchaeota archaeon]
MITVIFLLVVLSYYILFFIRLRKPPVEKRFESITVIIPAHNEERFISKTLDHVLAAQFKGKKQVIVVDDGSTDSTSKIVQPYMKRGVMLITQEHSGKAASLNNALKLAKGQLIAVVDGDSYIHKDSIKEMAKEVSRKGVIGSSCVVKVRNRKSHICMWYHLEQLYNSIIRLLFSKVNANIVTPGPLSVYRKTELLEAGGFSTEGFSEDIDVTIRLIRKGYRIGFAEKAITETNMPHDPKGIWRQRTRFARGMINIFKRHLGMTRKFIDVYTLPLFVFAYIQAVIMGAFTVYQVVSGYFTYYASQGVYFSFAVVKFLLGWFSMVGVVSWVGQILAGQVPLTFVSAAGLVAALLSYPMYIYAIFRLDRRIDLYHIIPFFFLPLFWLFIMMIYIISLPEVFRQHQRNIWKKNE